MRCIVLAVQAHNGCVCDGCLELEQAQVVLQRLEAEIWAAHRELDPRLGNMRVVGLWGRCIAVRSWCILGGYFLLPLYKTKTNDAVYEYNCKRIACTYTFLFAYVRV